MTVTTTQTVSVRDREILRRLGERLAVLAADPVMDERRRLWKAHSVLHSERPMLLAEVSGVLDELIPLTALTCEGEWARGAERGLRARLFVAEEVGDDSVVEAKVYYRHAVQKSGYGVEAVMHRGDDGHGHGSAVWDAPLQTLPDDLDKLHFQEYHYDEAATLQQQALLESVFGDVLTVTNQDWHWWTMGLTGTAINLIGLEELMLKMYDEPEGLHALMAFLRDDHLRMLDWYETHGMLTLNNDDSYIGSGSVGYTDALPQPGYTPGEPVRIADLWGLSESQETVSVSPGLFEEFVFPYQLPVISRFGLSYYGCCEPLERRWHIVKQIPNLRRVSVAPWSDEEAMAANLGQEYIYCRKPNPAYVSTKWEEDIIRQDLRNTLELTRGMAVEIAMKDVHTVAQQPWRLGRWVEIAREEIARVWG
ncbi:MAG TPA: hypothetical protein VGL77_20290 [Armatimonadota bacterium]|jgi:hypothetical protein